MEAYLQLERNGTGVGGLVKSSEKVRGVAFVVNVGDWAALKVARQEMLALSGMVELAGVPLAVFFDRVDREREQDNREEEVEEESDRVELESLKREWYAKPGRLFT